MLLSMLFAPGAGASAQAEERVLSFRDLEKLVRTRNPTSIEELLALLPEKFLSEYSLILRSHSSQFASPTAPRVILFGASYLTLVFSGAPDERGHDRLEIIEYDPSARKFDFREIRLEAATRASRPKERTISPLH